MFGEIEAVYGVEQEIKLSVSTLEDCSIEQGALKISLHGAHRACM